MTSSEDTALRQIADVLRAQRAAMEGFCEVVMQCGYTPADCRLDIYPDINDERREVLVVKGVECFEVVTRTRYEPDEMRVVYTFTPRIIEWPIGYPVTP